MSHSDNVSKHARAAGHAHVTSRTVHSSDGHSGHTANTAAAQMSEHYSMPPVSSEKVHQHEVEHDHEDGAGRHNEPEGRGVLGDLNAAHQTTDSPVAERGRQMPDKTIKSKAEEVAKELHRAGQGDEFEGVMTR